MSEFAKNENVEEKPETEPEKVAAAGAEDDDDDGPVQVADERDRQLLCGLCG